MKAADVVIQLRKVLPTLTDLFTTTVNISSLTKSGDTVTAVTSAPHNITNGDVVNIQGALTPFDISSLTNDGDWTAIAETLQAHDFTQGYPTIAELINADQSEYNGEIISRKRANYKEPLARDKAIDRELLSVPNRKKITYAITGTPASPATGSNIRIIQNFPFGYNGLHQITVVDPTTFTYQETKELASPAEGTNIKAHFGYRISHLINPERMIESYTVQPPDEAYAFVVLGAQRASRDVYTNSDFTIEFMRGIDYRQSVAQDYSVFVILPTKTSIGAGNFADFFSQEMNKYLIKSLVGVEFDSLFTNRVQYLTAFIGNSPLLYETAFYVHEYQFTQSYYLTLDDTADNDTSVAFRNLELKFDSDAGELMSTDVNLDDDPLP